MSLPMMLEMNATPYESELDWYRAQPFEAKVQACRLYGMVSGDRLASTPRDGLAAALEPGAEFWDKSNGRLIMTGEAVTDDDGVLGVMAVHWYGGECSIAFTPAASFLPNRDGFVEVVPMAEALHDIYA